MSDHRLDILLVEDDRNDAELTLRAFKHCFREVRTKVVKNGAEAMDFLRSLHQDPSNKESIYPRAIVSDLKMPKISGLELLRKLKEDKVFRQIPVIIFSSSSEQSDKKACYESFANSYITKPIDHTEFCNLVSCASNYWLNFNQAVDE